MVKFAPILFALLLPLPSQAALKSQIDKRELVLGEALTLSINGAPDALEVLDDSALKQDFEIRTRSLSKGAGSHSVDGVLTLTLYPLRTGKIQLPALAKTLRPLSVRVLESSETIPKILWHIELQPETPLTRQPVRLTLEACDDGSLEWKRPLLPTPEGIQLRTLGEERLDVERDGTSCTAHRWHWMLQPMSAGAFTIPIPMLEAAKFGQQLRYPAPQGSLSALAAPAWLPRETAIGKPIIKATAVPQTWPLDRPLSRRIEIEGAYNPADIKALLDAQLAAAPAFSVYRPVVEILAQSDTASPLTRIAITLYAHPHETGNLNFPELVFPYFDPASGSLQTERLDVPSVKIFNPLHTKLLWGAGALLVLTLLGLLGWWMKKAIAWRLAKQHGLKAIAHAQNIDELAQALRKFSLRANALPAVSLGTWRSQIDAQTSTTGVAELIALIEQTIYGRKVLRLEILKEAAKQTLKTIRPS